MFRIEPPKVSPVGRYTIQQSAQLMGVARKTIYNWIEAGVFKTSEYGKRNVGAKSTFIKGLALIRIWNETLK